MTYEISIIIITAALIYACNIRTCVRTYTYTCVHCFLNNYVCTHMYVCNALRLTISYVCSYVYTRFYKNFEFKKGSRDRTK